MAKKLTYKDSGVSIKDGEGFVSTVKTLFPEMKKGSLSAFGSLFNLKPVLKKYKNPFLVSSADGVGTKLKIAQFLGIHNTVGVDLVAMNVNDLVVLGAKPLFFLDYIACGKLNQGILKEVMKGIKKGLKESDCLLSGGETAEMPGMYDKDEYDLAGFCVGIVDRDKIVKGKNIKEGNVIIGLASNGLHSNGFSLVRKVFNDKEIKRYAGELLKPTRIYVRPVLSLLSVIRYPLSAVKGIAHITGGAFYNKATKILPENYGMAIDKKSWPVPSIFRMIQQKGNVEEKEMYSVFNMGIGMIIVIQAAYIKRALSILDRYGKSFLIGEVVKSKSKLLWSK